MRGALGIAELLPDGLEGRRVLVVAVHVTEQRGELGEGRRVHPTPVLLQAVLGAGLQLIEPPARLGHADHRHVQVSALQHGLQRRKDLLVGQIAGGPEEDEGV